MPGAIWSGVEPELRTDNVTLPPSQKLNGPLLSIDAVGSGLTTVFTDVVAEHPKIFVTVTENVPAVEGFIVCVKAPVDQR